MPPSRAVWLASMMASVCLVTCSRVTPDAAVPVARRAPRAPAPPEFVSPVGPTVRVTPAASAATLPAHAKVLDSPPVPDAGPFDAGVASPDAGMADAGAAFSGCLKLMPLGDSITIGTNGGYRNSLYPELVALGCGVDFVGSMNDAQTLGPDKDHEGHVGYNISDLYAHIDAWLLAAKPNYVLLLAGTNDIAWFTNETAAQIADRHALLVDRILLQQPEAWVIVGTMPPISSAIIPTVGLDRATLANDVNFEIASRVRARELAGKRVRLADVNGAVTLADLYDGVHPELDAGTRITNAWLQVLTKVTSCAVHPSCP